MSKSETDKIQKQIELDAAVERVWRALTDHREFSQWFRVNLETPFAVGEKTIGKIAIPEYQHVTMEVTVTAIEPMTLFAYTWHPYAVDPETDYSDEPPTLVEFKLERKEKATLLTIVESGFDALPAQRRDEAFRMNEGGWEGQIKNIATHVDGKG